MDYGTRDRDNVYIEAGEEAGQSRQFSAARVATAFGVSPDRVERAMQGEFDAGPNTPIDSRMAQRLAEVLLSDLPLDQREAALMQLGAYTPRSDASWGVGSGPPDEESDRLNAKVGVQKDELVSKRSSYAPSTQDAE